MKVSLIREKKKKGWENPHGKTLTITRSLPFFTTGHGRKIHIVRSGGIYFFDGSYRHTFIKFWCGNLGFASESRPGAMFLVCPPIGGSICLECESKAIKFGRIESREIGSKV